MAKAYEHHEALELIDRAINLMKVTHDPKCKTENLGELKDRYHVSLDLVRTTYEQLKAGPK